MTQNPSPITKTSMKSKSIYACQSCGYQTAKWLGKCPECNAWNSFVEETFTKDTSKRAEGGFYSLTTDKPVPLDEITTSSVPRYESRIGELDRALGGGIVPGSLTLLGGDPGIGKSTLVLMLLNNLSLNNISVLYVTGEESLEQIKMRAERLEVKANFTVVAENSLEKILAHVDKIKPQVLVVDSIQTVFLSHIESAPGSVSQVRECAGKLLFYSKSHKTSTILIGHVTKEGALAGPRILEHMVDTVLYFEGEQSGAFRILRTIKNRYGSTNEIGVFEMTSLGLIEVKNPSEQFISGRSDNAIGSCVTTLIEGTRPILTEIQALVSSSQLANPRRTCLGIDTNRVSLMIAVLEKMVGINLYAQDVYVNVAGGLKITEPSVDLAIVLALVSSYKNRALPARLVALGEVSLTGEVRPVAFADKRVNEAAKLGYKHVVLAAKTKLDSKHDGVELLRVKTVADVMDMI